jgi:DNA mismatch endonuclease (patch repair protein)
MVDNLTPAARSARMASIGGKNTVPELAVRRLAHTLGYRFRLHRRDLPGSPDLVFVKRRKIVFVHGCFWHGHACKRLPKSNVGFWAKKIESNRARDARNLADLRRLGWKALVVWQCETKDPQAVGARLRRFLGPRKNPIDKNLAKR